MKKHSVLVEHRLTFLSKLYRLCWGFVYIALFRFSPGFLFEYRNILLRAFGATIGKKCKVYRTSKIWYPKNLYMHDFSTIGPRVDCYNVANIKIGACVTISQNVYLCTASHDYSHPIGLDSPLMPLIVGDITIGRNAWVAEGAFVGPGICIGEFAIVLARSVVSKSVPNNNVVAGNPARFIKYRFGEKNVHK